MIEVLRPRGSKLESSAIDEWRVQRELEYLAEGRVLSYFLTEKQIEIYRTLLGDDSWLLECTEMWHEHVERIRQIMELNPLMLFSDHIAQYAFYITTAQVFSSREKKYTDYWLRGDNKARFYFNDISRFRHIYIDHYGIKTTESRVHHLTHLAHFEQKTGCLVKDFDTIIEFGGGYGGMTQLISKINKRCTQIIIDLPPILGVQYYSLANLIDKDIHVAGEECRLVNGSINMVYSRYVSKLRIKGKSLFIGTWSLSESDSKTFERIVDTLDLFGSDYVLYGYRNYDEVNTRQPMSRSLHTYKYEEVAHFCPSWTLDNDNKYQILKRKMP